MKILDFLIPSGEACRRSGPHDKIVLSSRVRLARNLKGFPFPAHAKKAERTKVFEALMPAVSDAPAMATKPFAEPMDALSSNERQLLVERHLVSREHAAHAGGAKGAGAGLVLNRDETLSVMINEEDHLRMQSLRPGLQLKQAWIAMDGLDTSLQESVEFAFSERFGYLTACPTNLGTGIRVSAMLHLPGLVLAEQISQIIQAVSKLGLAVRGLYGEGTEALGNIFQVSNQQTLGESEAEIVERLNKVVLQIIEHEENARASQLEKRPRVLMNQIGRAYGILSNAHIISSKETMNLLSLLRLAADSDLFPENPKALVDELFLVSQPAHLQQGRTDKLDAEQRDVLRADLLRTRMQGLAAPDARRLPPPPPAE
jgi:protein arginine kinase